MDQTRQYSKSLTGIRRDHVLRYTLAAKYASGRVLDAACGCGYGSSILQGLAQVVVGVDISPNAINWAEEHFPGPEYILGRIEEAPWAGKFETIVSFETIEHLKEPQKALDAFRSSCAGVLIASVPNEERYPFSKERFAGDEFPHQRHYRPKEFEELLKTSGFKVTEWFCQPDKKGDIHSGTEGMFLIAVCE